MNLRIAKILPLLAVLLLLAGTAPRAALAGPGRAATSAPQEDPNGARVIVRYRATSSILSAQSGGSGQGPKKAALMAQRTGLVLADGHLLDSRTEVVHGDKSLTSAQLAARLAADPEVESAWPDLRRHVLAAVPNDPLFPTFGSNGLLNPNTSPDHAQWYLDAPDAASVTPTAASNLSGINAQAAWNLTTGSASIVVADIDTGVRFDHPDLVNKLYPGRNFVSTTSATGTGWSADASDPGDYTTVINECGDGAGPENSSWHGTQVMGLIGAQTDNGIGIASIGYNVMLLPVRALGTCGGFDSDIIAGMLWAAGQSLPAGDPSVPVNPHPAQVINLSLGSDGLCAGTVYETFLPKIIGAGVTVVAAAGNGVTFADGSGGGIAVTVPANCPGVIAVAGVRNVGTKVGFSNLGPQVTISAPGGNCVSASGLPCLFPMITTTNGGQTTPIAHYIGEPDGDLYTNSTNYSLGTSFATPLVSGTVALMLSMAPTLTPAHIKSLLQSTARAFPASSAGATTTVPVCSAPPAYPAQTPYQDECICTTATCGAGLLDAGAAVAAASNSLSVELTPSASSVTVGTAVTFSSSGTAAANGNTIANYAWSIASGSSIAAISGTASGAAITGVSVTPTAAGSFTVQLVVTDSAGNSASQSSTVTVTGPTSPATTSSGGGGAMSFAWLAALALALWAVARTPRAAD